MANSSINIRPFTPKDAAQCARVFFDSINQGATAHYSKKQRQTWASKPPEGPKWLERLCNPFTYVATAKTDVIGFMTLNEQGYIDLAFVAPPFIGKGVGARLYDQVQMAANRMKLPRLHTQASLMAKPFFESRGWKVCNEQIVERQGVQLTNFLMEKQILDATITASHP